MTLEDLNKGFVELIRAVLEHGIDSVRDSDVPLVPFVVVESPGGDRQFQSCNGGVDQAMEFAASADSLSRVVMVYGGSATVDGEKSDAVLAVGRERGATNTVLVAQRYAPKKFLKKFATVGNPTVVGPGPSF